MRRLTLAVLIGMAFGGAQAAPLSDGYRAARSHDAQFMAAEPERESNNMAAGAAYASYLPSLSASQTKLETEATTRRTYALQQPIFAGDKAAAVMEGSPRSKLAEVVYRQRENELAQRYFKALADWLKASEGLRLVKTKETAFEQQYQSAKRSLEEGVGTVSERQDALLRVEQAKSEGIALMAQQEAAANVLQYMTGERPNDDWQLNAAQGPLPAPPDLAACKSDAQQQSPSVQQAQIDAELARIGVWKARGAMMPSVNFIVQRTESNGISSNYTGLTVNFPLNAGSAFSTLNASAAAAKQEMLARDSENKVLLDVSRLHGLVMAGHAEVGMRKRAIETAELAVSANEASFKGGVRSKTDVLNSIQALYQTKQDYVTARLNLAENYMNLMLLQATEGSTVFLTLDKFLFGSQ